MNFTVRERADTVATLRYISVRLMETVAGWVPTTPELEVKVLLGRHIWVFAQHADALGRRTAELRLAPQASRKPTDDFHALLDELGGVESTAGRLASLYDGTLPVVSGLCQQYLEGTDHIMDEPTVRIFDTMIRDLERLREERTRDLVGAPDFPDEPRDYAAEMKAMAAAVTGWVDFRPTAQGAAS